MYQHNFINNVRDKFLTLFFSSTFDPRASHFTGSTEADDLLANYPFLASPAPPPDSGLTSFKRFVQPFLPQNPKANMNVHARFPRVDESANIYQEPLIEFHQQFHQEKQLQHQKEQLEQQQQQLQQLQQQMLKNEIATQRQRHADEEKLTASIKRASKLSRPRRALPLEEESLRLREFSGALDEASNIQKPKALPANAIKAEKVSSQHRGAIPKEPPPPKYDASAGKDDSKKERERVIFYQDSESSF